MTSPSERRRDIVHACMHDFKHGALRTGSGAPVHTRKQALAIGLSIAKEAAPVHHEPVSPRVEQALRMLADVDPQLAAKVQPAERKQLALFHQAETSTDDSDHEWRYLGRELPTVGKGSIYQCTRCPVTKRTERRGGRNVITYANDGQHYRAARLSCARAQGGA